MLPALLPCFYHSAPPRLTQAQCSRMKMLCSWCSLCTQQCRDLAAEAPADATQPTSSVARSHGRGEGCKNPSSPCHELPEVWAERKPWQHFTLMRFFFSSFISRVNQAGQGETAGTHGTPPWGGRGKSRLTERSKITNKAERISIHSWGFLMKSAAQKSQGIFHFKCWLHRRAGRKAFKSLPLLIFFWFSRQLLWPHPFLHFPLGPLQPLCTPFLILVWFQRRPLMKTSPCDVCSSGAAGRVGRAAEHAKASPLRLVSSSGRRCCSCDNNIMTFYLWLPKTPKHAGSK